MSSSLQLPGGLLDHLQTGASWIALCIIIVGLLQNLLNTLHLVLAWRALSRRPPELVTQSRPLERMIPISLLVPAYNESLVVVDSVKSMLSLHYPRYEVVVINDGSKDDTLQQLITAFDLKPSTMTLESAIPTQAVRGVYESSRHSNLLVIDKENGGKADALNVGINASRYGLFCAVDADSLLEPLALQRAVQPFVRDPERVVAVGGTIRIANGCTVEDGRIKTYRLPERWLPLLQTLEYIRAFLMARLGWSEMEALLLVSGAFGIFRRDVAIMAGGYSVKTVGEDLELVVKMHRHLLDIGARYDVQFVPEPVCWTEAPETLKILGNQRKRWHRGALETFFKHGDMMFKPRYGRTGMLGFANALLVDVIGPIAEVLGYLLIPVMVLLGILDPVYLLAFIALTFIYGVFLSCAALILEEKELARVPTARDLAVLALTAVAENFGYRQLNNLWRVAGWWQYLRGRHTWGTQVRTGFRRS